MHHNVAIWSIDWSVTVGLLQNCSKIKGAFTPLAVQCGAERHCTAPWSSVTHTATHRSCGAVLRDASRHHNAMHRIPCERILRVIIVSKFSSPSDRTVLPRWHRSTPWDRQAVLDSTCQIRCVEIKSTINRFACRVAFYTTCLVAWQPRRAADTSTNRPIPRPGWVVRFAEIQRVLWRSRVEVADSA